MICKIVNTFIQEVARHLEENHANLKDRPLYGLPVSMKDSFGVKVVFLPL
jgi:Asp-tRNA(Asn)/Glu-tRNA(Gln) amidotransferase A subunit family amidase